jgi:hypothetical protein
VTLNLSSCEYAPPGGPRRAYALYSPPSGLIAGSVRSYALSVRTYGVKIGTVYGGERPGENWRALYRKGYRVIPVMIVPVSRA